MSTSIKCACCDKKPAFRQSMRLCVACWTFVPRPLQAQIVTDYNSEFDTGHASPPREWTTLVDKAVEEAVIKARGNSPLATELRDKNNLLIKIGASFRVSNEFYAQERWTVMSLSLETGKVRGRSLGTSPEVVTFDPSEMEIQNGQD